MNAHRVNCVTIKIMIACFVSHKPIDHVGDDEWYSAAGVEARDFLFKEGLVTSDWDVTPRGQTWITMLLRTPLPQQVWADPRDQIAVS